FGCRTLRCCAMAAPSSRHTFVQYGHLIFGGGAGAGAFFSAFFPLTTFFLLLLSIFLFFMSFFLLSECLRSVSNRFIVSSPSILRSVSSSIESM
ncbi:hypothetical protein PFISCL1PPCAC_4444, partial [Pristionchus fissidentatus]